MLALLKYVVDVVHMRLCDYATIRLQACTLCSLGACRPCMHPSSSVTVTRTTCKLLTLNFSCLPVYKMLCMYVCMSGRMLHVCLQDVEGHELAVLQGSLALLSRCRPILYLEILCEALSRPILTLLDSLGYASAWVITGNSEGPDFIYFSVLFRSLTSGTNIAAVPKHRAESLATGASTLKVLINDTSGDIFVEMANGYAFFPIDVTAKLFTLRDQQIFLTSKPRNDRRNVVAARQDLYGDGQCQLISQTDIDSWRSLVNPATLSLYEE